MKFKDEDIIIISKMIEKGFSYKKIALKFNCNASVMQRIVRRYKLHGLDGIIRKENNRNFDPQFKLEIINRHYSGESKLSLATEINVSYMVVASWITKYEQLGYNGLKDNRGRPGVAKMGRPRKNVQNNNNNKMAPLTDAEREELNELRKRTKRLEMEIEATKKLNALVQARIERETQKKRK